MRPLKPNFALIVLPGILALHCGGGSGPSSPNGGSGSWSLGRFQSDGLMTDCTNYVDAPRPSSLQGGTISSDVCPGDSVAGVCSGTNQAGQKYQQVFYDPPATPITIPYVMLNCTGI